MEQANLDDPGSARATMVAGIKPGLEVRAANDVVLGVVAQMQGKATVKLRQDPSGMYHYIPLSWVRKVDHAVHVDRSAEDAMREWAIVPPRR